MLCAPHQQRPEEFNSQRPRRFDGGRFYCVNINMQVKEMQPRISHLEDRRPHATHSGYAKSDWWERQIERRTPRRRPPECSSRQEVIEAFASMNYPPHGEDSLAGRIEAFITVNLEKGLTLKGLASFLGYSEKYSSEVFQLQMGTCFSHYVKRLRVLKAKRMLTGEETRVTHIAEALGFSDPFAFSHFFKRAVGCSPTAFRKQQLAQPGDK